MLSCPTEVVVDQGMKEMEVLLIMFISSCDTDVIDRGNGRLARLMFDA